MQSAEAADGRLPVKAPLANPYVPYQMEDPPKYEARKALVRGTLFPGLDLPFMGMVNQKELPETILSDLQALGFAIQELALYLDTHREDKEALLLYREYQRMYKKCKDEHSKVRGQMNHMMVSGRDTFDWIEDPWPWEYSANKEV